jgi:hypothetical protein
MVFEVVGDAIGGLFGGSKPTLDRKAAPAGNRSADQLRKDFMGAMQTKYNAPQYATPTIGGQAGNQFTNQALQLQQQAATGGAPSVAGLQQQQGLEQALRGQFAAANSARGGAGNQLQAALGAQNQGAQMQQAAINNAAQLRAAEMAAARGEYANSAFSQAGLEQQRNLANLGAQQQANALNQQGQLATNQLNQQQQFGALGGMQSAEQLRIQAELGDVNASAALQGAYQQQKGQIMGGLLGGIGGGLAMGAFSGPAKAAAPAAAVSDKKAKTNVKDGSKEAQKFLDALKAHVYEYKDKYKGSMAPEGEHISPMAQELEKTAAGKHMVKHTADGTKVVDYSSPQGYGAILASLSHLNKKIQELEGKGKKNG